MPSTLPKFSIIKCQNLFVFSTDRSSKTSLDRTLFLLTAEELDPQVFRLTGTKGFVLIRNLYQFLGPFFFFFAGQREERVEREAFAAFFARCNEMRMNLGKVGAFEDFGGFWDGVVDGDFEMGG